jgi:aryl-alcohol dehydrogenase-like predicted oxidoreductase
MDAIGNDELFATLEDLEREGKVRSWGVALGPAIGWREEGVRALQERPGMTAMQIIHNLLEQDPGADFLEAARENEVAMMARVTHSSGMLEGKYTVETTFPKNDHRSHRPRSWLLEGLQKIDRLEFLTKDREQTLGQAALKWLLADPLMVTTLPNIYGMEQLDEFAAAPDLPDLTEEDLETISALFAENFGVEPVAAT